MFAYIPTHIDTYEFLPPYISTCIHTYMMHTHILTYIFMHVFLYAYVCTSLHIHACLCA